MQLAVSLGMLIAGFVLLVKGADWFVDGASDIAVRFHVSTLVIGLTVVAMGTSLPEAAISISAAFKGSAGIAIGNVVGSNIMNIALILGITALIAPLAVQRSTRRYEIPIMILSTLVLAFLGLEDHVVSRPDGCVLLIIFIVYLLYTIRIATGQPLLQMRSIFRLPRQLPADPGPETSPPRRSKRNRPTALVLTITALGAACIAIGANLTVDGATEIARMFGISEDIIGLTIVAFGTSLPELVTCVTAALKKEADIAVGNIVGSNIFNVLFVIGAAAAIHPVSYREEFAYDTIVCIVVPALLWLLVANRDSKLKRWGGAVLLACYTAYFLLFNLDLLSRMGL